MESSVEYAATLARVRAERDELRRRLEEAEETLRAIRGGEVDAFLIDDGEGGERVYTLEGAERPYRTLVECMQQGALVLTVEGTVLFANGRLATLLGVPNERLAGVPLTHFIAPADQPEFAAALRAGLGGRGLAEVTLHCSNDARVPAHITVSPLPLSASAAPVLCAVVTDLTEQRQYEELQRAQAALKDADRRKDEFLATLAHELRNPLAPVRSAAQILRIKASSIPEVQWAQEVIERQVDQMTRLVDDLLDLSRVTTNQITLRRERVELASVVQTAVETSLPVIDRAGHKLTVALPREPVILDADHTRLAQVVANLLNNAAKYTNKGGRIDLRAEVTDAEVVVTVEDNGVGIPAHLLPRVFDMFTQVDRSLERSQSGLGIGLTLAKRLVELHGGTIGVRSEVGFGSTFTVRFPHAVVGAEAQKSNTDIDGEPVDVRLHILVVDDNADSADSLAMLLRMRGHDARAAYDGSSALEVGANYHPDVILLDLGMPHVDGHETCRRIREQEWGVNARVVALTGWGQQEDRRRTREAGFDFHLVKPVEPNALSALLDRFAESRAVSRSSDGQPSFRAPSA